MFVGERAPATRVQLVGAGLDGQTTARLFGALEEGLRASGWPASFEIRNSPGNRLAKGAEFRASWAMLRDAKVLVIHTPLTTSVITVAAAVVRRRPIVAYVWDLHPESMRELGHDAGRAKYARYWILERLVMALAAVIVVPSDDYRSRLGVWGRKAQIIPLWPSDPLQEVQARGQRDQGPVRVAFAGQVNGSRGLEGGLTVLGKFWADIEVELHLFGPDRLDLRALSAPANVTVIDGGNLHPAELQQRLSAMDFGWVCLDPSFSLPAYPSKALAYLAAGIPVLFSGPEMPEYRAWIEESGLGVSVDRGARDDSRMRRLDVNFADARERYVTSMRACWFEPEFLTGPARRRRWRRA